jgi:tetratricopeptide (TPR) repeat protein
MAMTRLILCWLLLIPLTMPGAAAAAAGKNPAESVVTVVGLDDEGRPSRQGLGVVVGKDGKVLTSAALLNHRRGGVIRSGAGGMRLIRKVVHWDILQDLAVVEGGEENLLAPPLNLAPGLRLPEKVGVAVRHDKGIILKEAQVTGRLPFSPRLVLLKLEPANLEAEPGAPIISQRGEVVGMLHAFGGGPAGPGEVRFFLARDRKSLPPEKDFKANSQIFSEEPPESPDSAAYAAFWEGVAASLKQEWKGAQAKFSAALSLPGGLPEAYYGRGVARYHLKDARAAQDLLEATRLLPGYALAFMWLGQVYDRQGRPDAAKAAYEKAVSLAPDLSEAQFRLGLFFFQQEKLGQARGYLEKAGDDFPQAAQKWWYLGIIARTQNRLPAAQEAFGRALKLDPGFFQAYLEEGRLLTEDLGRSQEAIILLKKAVTLNPKHPTARYYLALAYINTWNRAGAWEQYFVLQETAPSLAADLAAVLERGQ